MSNVTQRNTQSAPLTAINQSASSITVKKSDLSLATAINTQREKFSHLLAGTIVLGKYVVKQRLDVTSGEAEIYICERSGKEYIAKIYNRANASLDSPYFAKIYETGTHEGHEVSILPYYKLAGAVQRRHFAQGLKTVKHNVSI